MNTRPSPSPSHDSNSDQLSQRAPRRKAKRSWMVSGIGAAVLLLGAAGITGCSDDKEATTPTSASASTVTVAPSTVTVQPTATTSAETAAPAPVAPTTTSAAPAGGIMPAVVCMNLQAAQNLIQDNGVFYSRSEDATGEGRMQVNDSNWVVVSQSPEPGAAITEGDAVLSVVKIGETSAC